MMQFIDDNGKPHEIHDCPFCGNQPRLAYLDEEYCERPNGYDEDTDKASIICDTCDLCMSHQITFKDDTIELIKKWNKRVRE